MRSSAGLFRLLGDEVRLRVLRLLAAEALNVTELTGIVGIAQSGVSRHLGLLRDAGLVSEERSGGYTWFRLNPAIRNGEPGSERLLWPMLEAQFTQAADPVLRADDAKLQEVLRLRKESFAEHGAAEDVRQLVPGRSWPAWARALGYLLPAADVADLGCGDGYLTIEAARWARRVTAVDRSPDMLTRGRELAKRRKVSNITWKRGELEKLPLADASVDIALLSQALHHAVEPARALSEALRVLRPGGRLLVLDLRQHDQAWVTAALGDRWLGFKDADLKAMLTGAGFDDVRLRVGARKTGDPFTVLVAGATRPAAAKSGRKEKHR
ncbi:MAG: metalloregulator ArsR/SmtB family transcription factor [Acidobacteriota bacterium]|nr:metalloregulator ArsR/SmtB family transcription factor [Acidobacteriota bacterium]